MAKYHDNYERVTWANGVTALSAEHMNNIEDGIEDIIEYKVEKETGKGLSTNDYTDAEKTKLAGIAAGAEVNVQSDWNQSSTSADDFIKNKPGNATTSAAGFMSAADKTKLNGIATGAEVNQNAFSNVKVGSTTVAADGKTDTLELVAGSNVTLTPDATNDKVTIAATDTKYSAATTSAAGLMSAADKTKLDRIEAGANKVKIAESEYTPSTVVLVRQGEKKVISLSSFTIGGVLIGISEILFMNGSSVDYPCLCGWNVDSSGKLALRVSNATSADINITKVKIKAAYITT